MTEDQLDFAVDATIYELQDDPTLRRRIRERQLRTIAWNRLKIAGFLATCGRCGGTGKYGPYWRNDGNCFSCGGSRYRIPRFTETWKRKVLAFDWREFMRERKSET